MEKTCSKCSQPFASGNRRGSVCKPCLKIQNDAWRAKRKAEGTDYYSLHRQEILKKRKEQYDADPRKFLDRRIGRTRKPYPPSYTPEQRRWMRLWKEYGLSEADYTTMLNGQGGKCAICTKELGNDVCVDHDHATGMVRALLCRKCNLGLGYLMDDPEVLRAAAAYVERYRCNTP